MKLKQITSKSQIYKNDSSDGYLIKSSEKEARRIIESLKGKDKAIAFVGGNDALNRRAIEKLKINYLVSPERGKRRDSLKQRDSGLNHVLAKAAAKNKITILIDIEELSKLKGKERAERLARIIQNIKICKKAKCKIQVISFTNKFDKKQISDFGKSLGL